MSNTQQKYGDLISSLNYSCYRYNRDLSPDVTPDQWRLVFGSDVDELERQYQQEKELAYVNPS